MFGPIGFESFDLAESQLFSCLVFNFDFRPVQHDVFQGGANYCFSGAHVSILYICLKSLSPFLFFLKKTTCAGQLGGGTTAGGQGGQDKGTQFLIFGRFKILNLRKSKNAYYVMYLSAANVCLQEQAADKNGTVHHGNGCRKMALCATDKTAMSASKNKLPNGRGGLAFKNMLLNDSIKTLMSAVGGLAGWWFGTIGMVVWYHRDGGSGPSGGWFGTIGMVVWYHRDGPEPPSDR
jgi:hypothetical protein